jgi:hypothetical protein
MGGALARARGRGRIDRCGHRRRSRRRRSCAPGVSILRNRSHYLGDVQATDENAAEAAAVVEFKLTDDQRKRVVVQEREADAS